MLLIILYTLAPDQTSIYNSELDTTPHLKALADKSLVFNSAYSTSSWTKHSIFSAFTALYPSQHKADKLYVPRDRSFETLAERIKGVVIRRPVI